MTTFSGASFPSFLNPEPSLLHSPLTLWSQLSSLTFRPILSPSHSCHCPSNIFCPQQSLVDPQLLFHLLPPPQSTSLHVPPPTACLLRWRSRARCSAVEESFPGLISLLRSSSFSADMAAGPAPAFTSLKAWPALTVGKRTLLWEHHQPAGAESPGESGLWTRSPAE